MTLALTNTEIAFKSKSNSALRRSAWLFRIIQRPWIVRLGSSLLQWLIRLRFPVEALVKRTLFQQFCGGESIEECEDTLMDLGRYRVGAILDYSAEGLKTERGFQHTADEIIRTVDYATENPDVPFCVFKPSGIAGVALFEKLGQGKILNQHEMTEWAKVRERFRSICERAHRGGVRVFIDAEETWTQEAVDKIAEEQMARLNREKAIVFTTLQMYRTDRLAHLEKLFETAEDRGFFIGVKLVRGAYMEKERERAAERNHPSPIHADKAACDAAYDAAIKYCIDRADRISICAGTHNESSTQLMTQLMEAKGIERRDPRMWFAQLLGMSDHLTYNLADAGYNVAKYVPYGPVRLVVPYLVRRAEENTSIKGQTSRELALVEQERRRRRRG